MNEIEFVEQLRDVPFSHEVYSKIGLDKDYIIERISTYNPIEKKSNQNTCIDDPLVRLVTDYDVSSTEIGMVWFGSKVTETDNYFYVGKFEVDFLCVSRFSKEVVVLSFEDPLTIAYLCAQNSFLFLEAMIVAAKFLEKCGIDESLYNDQKAICSMAENCAELSGGEKYLDFYKVLLGCEL